jgi:hypothetical protein
MIEHKTAAKFLRFWRSPSSIVIFAFISKRYEAQLNTRDCYMDFSWDNTNKQKTTTPLLQNQSAFETALQLRSGSKHQSNKLSKRVLLPLHHSLSCVGVALLAAILRNRADTCNCT